MKIATGTKFRSVYADSNALWRVVKSRGEGIWECRIDDSEPDWAGKMKLFSTEEIEQALRAALHYQGLVRGQTDFWASQELGTMLHYHDSFGRYVRGRVVDGLDNQGRRARVLKPFALVGAWGVGDLPRWHDSGFASKGGYHVRKIAEGETFQPSPGSVWESPTFSGPMGPASRIDPTVLEPIDLSLPEPTPTQARAAKLLGVVNEVMDCLRIQDHASVTDYAETYSEMIVKAAEVLDRARDELEPSVGPATPR